MEEFRGHTSFINDVAFSGDSHHILSASINGSTRLWSIKTTDFLFTYKALGNDVPINSLLILP